MTTRSLATCITLFALSSALLAQSSREYRIHLGSDDYSMESSLNRAAEAGYRFHSIAQRSAAIHVEKRETLSSAIASRNRLPAIVESGFKGDRYSYRVISAAWEEMRKSTEDELAQCIEEQLNKDILNKLKISAENGFSYLRKSMYFLVRSSADDKRAFVSGVRVILEKDNSNNDRSSDYKVGKFRILIAARANTIERELNEAAKSNYYLQSAVPIASVHSKFTGYARTVLVLAYDESKRVEYRVIHGTVNKNKISIPSAPNRKKTLKNLNALSAEGYTYFESVPNTPTSFMTIHERDLGANGELVPVHYNVASIRHRKLSVVSLKEGDSADNESLNVLFEASRDGYQLAGLMWSGGIGIVAKP